MRESLSVIYVFVGSISLFYMLIKASSYISYLIMSKMSESSLSILRKRGQLFSKSKKERFGISFYVALLLYIISFSFAEYKVLLIFSIFIVSLFLMVFLLIYIITIRRTKDL